MDFSEATIMRVKAQDASDTFTQACKDREQGVKEEMEALIQVFRGLLEAEGAPKAFAVTGGGYLYKKERSSIVSVSKDRLGQAVVDLTISQLRKKYKTMREEKVPTITQVVQACIQDNLEKACTNTTCKVEVVQRRPANLIETSRAPPNTDKMAQRYLMLKKRLAEMRKHKAQGRKRCADVADITEPIIQQHMEKAKVQRVRLTPLAAALTSPPFSSPVSSSSSSSLSPMQEMEEPMPELPTLLPHHEIENKMSVSTSATPEIVTVVASASSPDQPERLIEFKKRVYKSRGKSIKPKDFIQGMQRAIAKVPSPDHSTAEEAFRWWLGDGNQLLMQSILLEYTTIIDKSKAPPTEKLKLKILA